MKGHKWLVKDPRVDVEFNSKYCSTYVFFKQFLVKQNLVKNKVPEINYFIYHSKNSILAEYVICLLLEVLSPSCKLTSSATWFSQKHHSKNGGHELSK